MAHQVQALILPGSCRMEAAQEWDLVPVQLDAGMALAHVTHYFTAYWQARRGLVERLEIPSGFPVIFPSEGVILQMAADISGVDGVAFAVVMTEYFGGAGSQWACVFRSGATRPSLSGSINEALRALGVHAGGGRDEFDMVGLSRHRRTPEYLDRYEDLCDELGV